jgi:hypothetical protein
MKAKSMKTFNKSLEECPKVQELLYLQAARSFDRLRNTGRPRQGNAGEYVLCKPMEFVTRWN